ncbi:ROK family protein [Sphingomonas sp. S1-29]|uniref:ROK family protein n=1 Tax=Sphingomonas sp. S1-29 TaxID=2991074 RepID=UPI00224095B3|nr:ROK family protein [Sphingomonas sp. S1-29]UZK69923.1 ROK family protein [Sphingomonas sp. S1-29]
MASDTRSTAMLPLAGVELGGTKCIVTLAHGPGAILDQHHVATTLPAETLPAIVAVLEGWHRTQGFGALGIASFGPLGLDPRSPRHGRILNTPKPGWSGADVLGVLSSRFDVPTGLDTDVNGAALAEIRWGCAQGLDDFAYVTVGTGIGVGLIVHGRPTRGIGHSEIGHVRLPRTPGDHLQSVCAFHPDCVEGLASGTALRARLGGRALRDVAPDDPVWVPMVDAIAAMCHALLCTTGPRRIAIGGGVVSGQPHLLARIEAALRLSLNGYLELPDERMVVAPALGADAGPLGSIELAARALETPRFADQEFHSV